MLWAARTQTTNGIVRRAGGRTGDVVSAAAAAATAELIYDWVMDCLFLRLLCVVEETASVSEAAAAAV